MSTLELFLAYVVWIFFSENVMTRVDEELKIPKASTLMQQVGKLTGEGAEHLPFREYFPYRLARSCNFVLNGTLGSTLMNRLLE